ncbi:hypothetical protein BKP35_06540 [Anaerobacillus arseniciselenatis]|uniref:HTH tetR-type domain-containing protein n=1 Tax=Anaerobacillus arseniciselenatis TaxID=85682 RepID=A0A1S2LPX5_9BACI|nr:TetR/AcrR family transcriptional regulator [Anaerobacillus arseniciselenatis]OIJ14531.1 hypothetical protein BKP35_06540 [Anaerobacillus arseniciselenatis]
MNERKQHVINKTHELFMKKGYEATSIQDILAYSEISKGTFYNYFSSKSELLMAIIKNIYDRLEKERADLLVGKDPANAEIFIQQIDLQIKTNRVNKLIPLFEEVLVSNDEELKHFLKENQFKMLRWLNSRFIDIFGESKKTYLLNCAIMFMGILQYNLKYSTLCYGANYETEEVVRYSFERISEMVTEVANADVHLIPPEALENLLSNKTSTNAHSGQQLNEAITKCKNAYSNAKEPAKYYELLDFIQDELSSDSQARRFLIESAIASLKSGEETEGKLLKELEAIVTDQLLNS